MLLQTQESIRDSRWYHTVHVLLSDSGTRSQVLSVNLVKAERFSKDFDFFSPTTARKCPRSTIELGKLCAVLLLDALHSLGSESVYPSPYTLLDVSSSAACPTHSTSAPIFNALRRRATSAIPSVPTQCSP